MKSSIEPVKQAARIKPGVERQRNPGDRYEKDNQPTTWATEAVMAGGLSPVSRARGFVNRWSQGSAALHPGLYAHTRFTGWDVCGN
jgi:hypothetical protein